MAFEDVLLDALETYAKNRPRSLQKTIGPSGLGHPCDHCLGAMLAGFRKTEEPGGWWLPLVGTAFHALAEVALAQYNETVEERFLIEQRVTVGEVNGIMVEGNLDGYDIAEDIVFDWKLVGVNTLGKPPSGTYLTQIDLYALGVVKTFGYEPKGTCIMYMPRNKRFARDGMFVKRRWDRGRAEEALARADRIARLVQTNRAAVAWLPRDPACWDCSKFAI